ncbi:MAG: twin-arginine translocase TatA/TatE family subunit [Phycisphaerales bacterium]|jgi:sec-independent protein translocase protein TatA
MHTLAFGLGSFTTMDMVILLAVGLLIFGGRLPEVGKNLGRGIIEFKKGLKSVEEDIETGSTRPAPRPEVREIPDRQPMADEDDRRVSRAEKVEATRARAHADDVH